MKKNQFRVINLGKRAYVKPDEYLNGWAKHCKWKASLVFDSLCRHSDRRRESFPSIDLMAEEREDISEKEREAFEARERRLRAMWARLSRAIAAAERQRLMELD